MIPGKWLFLLQTIFQESLIHLKKTLIKSEGEKGDRFIFLIFSVFLAPEIPPVFQFSFLSHPRIVNCRSTVPFFSYSFGTIPYLSA